MCLPTCSRYNSIDPMTPMLRNSRVSKLGIVISGRINKMSSKSSTVPLAAVKMDV